jgi:chitin synthase
MDDFSWGNTRKVVGEGDKKTVVYENDEPFNDNMIPYKSFKGESRDTRDSSCTIELCKLSKSTLTSRIRSECMGDAVPSLGAFA